MSQVVDGDSKISDTTVSQPNPDPAKLARPGSDADIHIHIVSSEKESQRCEWWVGIYRRGELSPQELVKRGALIELMRAAATVGINADGPIILVDPCLGKRKLFLETPVAADRSHETWIVAFADRLGLLNRHSPLGFYFAPESFGDQAVAVMGDLMQALLSKSPGREYYLFTGEHGLYPVLDMALRLKENLLLTAAKSSFIFH